MDAIRLGRHWRCGWLLTDHNARFETANGLRQVFPDEGVLFLYAIWFSMQSTYTSVQLVDGHERPLDVEELLADLGILVTR